MRCSCQVCGTYMVHAESMGLGCVCPECGQRCRQCLGTNTVVSRDLLKETINKYMTMKEGLPKNDDDTYGD